MSQTLTTPWSPAASSPTPPFRLLPVQAMTLNRCAGREIVVLQGRLWVTEPDGGEDHVLHAHERLRLRAGQGVVIESLGPGPAIYRLD